MDSLYESDFSGLAFPFMLTVNRGESPFIYHWHDEIEIIYVIEAQVEVGVGSLRYNLAAGDVLVLAGGLCHCFFAAPPKAQRLAVKFSPALLAACGTDVEHFARCAPYSGQWDEDAKADVVEILLCLKKEYEEKRPGYRAAIMGLVHRLLLVAARRLPAADTAAAGAGHKGRGLKAVLAWLGGHYTGEVTLQTCAAENGFNPSYLSRFFYAQTGVHFHTYLEALRLRRVEWLLLNSRDSVLEVAAQSGYPNVKTLNRVFKARWGVTPSQFRAQEGAAQVVSAESV